MSAAALSLLGGPAARAVATAWRVELASSVRPGSSPAPRSTTPARPSGPTGPSALRLLELGGRRVAVASASARQACLDPAPAANRASWLLELGLLGDREVALVQPLAEEARQGAGPLGVAADDPRGGLLEARRPPRSGSPATCLRVEPAAVHLVERDQGRAADRAAGRLPGRPRSLRVVDLDQGIGQRVLEDAVRPSSPTASSRAGHGRLVADPPEGLGRGAAVLERRRPLSSCDQQRARPRGRAGRSPNGSPPGGPSRRGRPGRRGRPRGRRRWSIRSRPRRRSAAPRASGSACATASASAGSGVVARLGPGPAIARWRTAGRGSSSSGELVGGHRRPVELQPARVVDRAAPCAADAVDRRPARRACGAARSGSRACTSRRCRPRAGCRRRPRARRSGGSRGCRETRKSSSLVVNVAPLGREDVPA